MPITIPPNRNPGDGGHVSDHNTLNGALSSLSDSIDGLAAVAANVPLFCQATAPTNPIDGTIWLDRTTKSVKVWNSSSSIWETF